MAPRKPKVTPATNELLESLKFLSLVTKAEGAVNETHIRLDNNQASAFNGVLSAGTKIKEDLSACPHNTTFLNALSKCGQNLSMTQLDMYRISIKSDKFKAIVPCIDPELIGHSIPDLPIADINDQFKLGLESVGILATDDDKQGRIYCVSVLMAGQSLIGSNGVMIFEFWTGCDLPPGIALPNAVAKILTKTNKQLSRFGFSRSSVTFYFTDGSWLKSQLYSEPWPDVAKVLNVQSNPRNIPADFFEGLAAVAPFSPDGLCRMSPGKLHSHDTEAAGAVFECEGIPGGVTYSAKQLALLRDRATAWDFVDRGSMVFFGPKIRGIIGGRG